MSMDTMEILTTNSQYSDLKKALNAIPTIMCILTVTTDENNKLV